MVNAKRITSIDVYETKEYDALRPLPGQPINRAAKNASKLAKELVETGGNVIPVLVTERFEVIDGNTRVEACRLKGLPVRFQIIPANNEFALEMMRMMNAATTPWTINNFIGFYASAYNILAYKDLESFMEIHKISIGTLQELDQNISKEIIQNGRFTGTDWDTLEERVEHVKSMREALGQYMKSELHIARGIMKMIRYGFDNWDELYDKVKRYISREMRSAMMNRIDGSEAMLAIIQKCYNRRRQPKVRIYDDLST